MKRFRLSYVVLPLLAVSIAAALGLALAGCQ